MENKKDIGKAFREKLDQLDKSPNENLWNAIHADLQKKKKRRVIFIPFWIKMAGIFALGGLFTLFVLNDSVHHPFSTPAPSDGNHPGIYKNDRNDAVVNGNDSENVGRTNDGNNTVANAKENTISSENRDTPESANTSIKKSKSNSETETSDSETRITNPKTNTKNASEENGLKLKNSIRKTKKNAVATNNNPLNPKALASKRKPSSKKHSGKSGSKNEGPDPSSKTALVAEKNPILDASGSSIANAENKTAAAEPPLQKTDSLKIKKEAVALKKPSETEKDSTKTKEKNSFNLFVYGSPTYTGLISDTSPIDKRLANNPVKSKITWSYGAYLSYDATPKWSLRFGVGMTNMKLITQNAPINVANYNYINYTKNTNAAIYSQSNDSLMDITQDISYIEIPLELKYAIINKKFGVNAFGGISYMFRDKNSVTAETHNGMKFKVGDMKNLVSSSYSIHLGIGLDYKFSRRLRFNFEPVFKYHLVDYKDTGRVNLYTVGILTGLQFSLTK
ncbi:MAG TPA: outer membrane beta-barrel protein [Flavobacterium sp.]|nr:outer membrane beta-barrel protein [Flavobacterium sp.]